MMILLSALEIHGARREKFLDLEFFRNQALLMRVVDKGFEHRTIGLDAVGKRIFAKDLPGLRQIFSAEKQSRRQAFGEPILVELLGAHKGLVQVKSQPG